jgi:hypothetical protein
VVNGNRSFVDKQLFEFQEEKYSFGKKFLLSFSSQKWIASELMA